MGVVDMVECEMRPLSIGNVARAHKMENAAGWKEIKGGVLHVQLMVLSIGADVAVGVVGFGCGLGCAAGVGGRGWLCEAGGIECGGEVIKSADFVDGGDVQRLKHVCEVGFSLRHGCGEVVVKLSVCGRRCRMEKLRGREVEGRPGSRSATASRRMYSGSGRPRPSHASEFVSE